MQHKRARHTLATVAGSCAVCIASAVGYDATNAWAAGHSPSDYASMLNAERAAHGLSTLRTSADLAAIAQQWSARMASSQTLSHNPGLTTQVHNWQSVGENVGEGPTIDDLDTAFLNSAEHRANILDRTYQEFGVGYTVRNGIIWIAVDFRDPQTSTTATETTPAPATSAPAMTSQATASSAFLPTRHLLQLGSLGAKVAHVQRMLGVKHDGIFGPRTHHAVVRFQRRHHLDVDGVVGPKTRAALRRIDRTPHPQPVVWLTLSHGLNPAVFI